MKTFKELTSKQRIKKIEKYFSLCLTDGNNRGKKQMPSLKFNLDKDWLEVQYLNIKNYHPSDDPEHSYGYKFLCAQNIKDYDYIMPLINRLTLLLAVTLIRNNQDINGLFDENTITKKPF